MSVRSLGTEKTQSIYTPQFFLLCLSSYLFFASFNAIIPELPDYLSSLGGKDYIGLIIALFTAAALISRPFSGRLTDTVGRIPIMMVGAIVCFIMGILYTFVHTVIGFLIIRFFHGFSTGFKPTATSAYVSDVSPLNRRGEAIGVLGMSGSIGAASGPAIGSWLALNYSMDTLFIFSSVLAILSVAVLMRMKETLKDRQTFHPRLLKLHRSDFFEKRAFHAAFYLAMMVFPYGVILTIIPEMHKILGLENKGLYFSVLTIFSIVSRFFGGKVSDAFGQRPILLLASVLMTSALVITSKAQNTTTFFVGAACYGLSTGISYPAIFAWVLDVAYKEKVGRAVATAYMALEFGIGIAALASGYLFASAGFSVHQILLWTASVTAFSFIYVILIRKSKTAPSTNGAV